MKNLILSLIVIYSTNALAEALANVSAANNQFAIELYKVSSSSSYNLFFSPFSISAALAMTSAGAKNKTLSELNTVLRLPESAHVEYKDLLKELKSTIDYELLVANKLWVRAGYTYYPEFLNLLKTNYGSDITPLDFRNSPEPSRLTINQWTEDNTKKLIKNLIPPMGITSDTELVITNAIYFKGKWVTEFKKTNTMEGDFFTQPNQGQKTRFMKQTESYQYAENSDCQYLEMPYKGGQLSMAILLPKEGVSFSRFEKKVSTTDLDKIRRQATTREVIVTMPKFKTESEFELSAALKKMGIQDAFNSDRADFSGIRTMNRGSENIYISKVIHKAFVDVSEEGTEAAAATAVMMRAGGMRISTPVPPVVFKANRPFLFLIKHDYTNTILFLGRCIKP